MPDDLSARDLSSPSTREGWLRDFAALMRLRGMDGVRIGEELARVETHCDDSGQEPKEVFGDPASYIATLHVESPRSVGRLVRLFLPILALVIGAILAVAAMLHWSWGEAIATGLGATLLIVSVFTVMLVRS
jgi:hypothetical protein